MKHLLSEHRLPSLEAFSFVGGFREDFELELINKSLCTPKKVGLPNRTNCSSQRLFRRADKNSFILEESSNTNSFSKKRSNAPGHKDRLTLLPKVTPKKTSN
ncbi:hypothetical protein CEXT_420451 [Caerostris extrusa]|uniref:Uncharacterized protein n=1 Tax=Caerostris extrusa TaxID=172846 RepID=A0AAV4PPR5_CAEEX|nr:hypothetical protein CEXT_420451 [Caerostris extrusa]